MGHGLRVMGYESSAEKIILVHISYLNGKRRALQEVFPLGEWNRMPFCVYVILVILFAFVGSEQVHLRFVTFVFIFCVFSWLGIRDSELQKSFVPRAKHSEPLS